MTELDRQKLDVFHNSALRRISRIFWADKVTNKVLYEGTHSEPMSAAVKRKRLVVISALYYVRLYLNKSNLFS